MKSIVSEIGNRLRGVLDHSMATKDRPVQFQIITLGFLITALGCIAYS